MMAMKTVWAGGGQEGEMAPVTRVLPEASCSFLSRVLGAHFHSWAPSLTFHSPWMAVHSCKCHSKGGSRVTNPSQSTQNSSSFKTESPRSQDQSPSWANGSRGSLWEAGPYSALFLGINMNDSTLRSHFLLGRRVCTVKPGEEPPTADTDTQRRLRNSSCASTLLLPLPSNAP